MKTNYQQILIGYSILDCIENASIMYPFKSEGFVHRDGPRRPAIEVASNLLMCLSETAASNTLYELDVCKRTKDWFGPKDISVLEAIVKNHNSEVLARRKLIEKVKKM